MKKKILILYGGKSVEHEVSINSAQNVIRALNPQKYMVDTLKIEKDYIYLETIISRIKSCDVVFPILHGPFGEDGTVQGLLKLMNVPFVGADVLGSAIGMAKDVTKRLLKESHILTTDFLVFTSNDIDYSSIKQKFGLPFFVKPANLGSSVGVNKVFTKAQLTRAIKEAFSCDAKILVEKYVKGREIECSVLGNEDPIVSLPGEVIVKKGFYSYEAKYIDPNVAVLKIPVELPDYLVKEIQNIAIKTFKTLCCSGMARVDFFLDKTDQIYVNEINTIPGFTNISMYPKLWEASGISYSELLDRLVNLAIERHRKEQKLKTSYV